MTGSPAAGRRLPRAVLTYRGASRLHLMEEKSGKALCLFGGRASGTRFWLEQVLLEFRNCSNSSYGQSAQVRIA
jgi:hypothetical protein